MLEIVSSIVSASMILATPILFAALGEIFAERAGVLNLGIEGIMSLSAFVALWVTFSTGSYVLGLMAALLAASGIALLHAIATVRIGVNQLITGLLILSLATGIANFSYRSVSATTIPTVEPLQPIPIPLLSQIPILGPFLFSQNILVYLALTLTIIFGLVLYRTTLGLKIRAVGENPYASDAAGINVNRIRLLCVVFGGVLAGLAGATLTLGYLGIYEGGIVAGRGWIAIVVVIFSRWSPYRAVIGSILFGLGYSIASGLIGIGVGIPYYFLLMLPYIIALVAISFFRKGRAPAGLTVPYKRK